MTMRVGIYVGADWLAGVAVSRQGVVWHAVLQRTSDSSLYVRLSQLLDDIPVGRFARTQIFVALGPALTHVKQLRTLPPIAAPRVLRQLIEAAPSRFFLAEDAAPVVADPVRSAEGWWVAVADAKTIAAVDAACARGGMRGMGARPASTLLDAALAVPTNGTRIAWCDGDIALDIVCGDRGIASIRRESVRSRGPDVPASPLDGPLERIGGDAWRCAAAYAAARAGSAAPLKLRRRDDGHRTRYQTVRGVVVVASLVASGGVMLAAPGVVAARVRRENDREFTLVRAKAAAVAKHRVAVERQQSALGQIRTFSTSRRLLTPLLSSLSLQLPESTAIVALRLDTLGGALVALSPVGTDVAAAVSTTPGIDAIQLSAPITREMVGPLELQRMGLRFRFKARVASALAQRR